MKKYLRVVLPLAACAGAMVLLPGCGQPPPVTLVAAPPGPADLGPATGLSTPRAGAIVFDLKYRAETGGPDDIQYQSFWGYGGDDGETKTNTFLQSVREKASHLHFVCNYSFTGRKWAAVEYRGRQAQALYFDLDANGKLGPNERILPTRKGDQGVQFITPDFVQAQESGGQVLTRALLQVDFYGGNDVPNCMWSPAALLEGTATLNGQPARVLLFANRPGGSFEQYGSSSYSLLLGEQAKTAVGEHVGRGRLSSLVARGDEFYHLALEGRRTNGLPARLVLMKDTSPTGAFTLKVTGSNAQQTSINHVYLHGIDETNAFFSVDGSKGRVTLPAGRYGVESGQVRYGVTNVNEWEVSFRQGPSVAIKAGEVAELLLGQPMLKVRAIEERDRYNDRATELSVAKQGKRLYFEPQIIGKSGEVFSRFQQSVAGKNRSSERPPRIRITGADGKQVLSMTMEYG